MIKGLDISGDPILESHREPIFIETALKHVGWESSKTIEREKRVSTWGATASIAVAFLFVVMSTLAMSSLMEKVEWYGKTNNAWWVRSMTTAEPLFEKENTKDRTYQENYLQKPIVLSFHTVIRKLTGVTVVHASSLENEKWYARRNAQSHAQINIDPGNGFTIEATFMNSGTYTWYSTGPSYVSLVSSRDTDMRHDFWYSAIEPAKMSESVVKPGQTTTFRFAIQAPKNKGIYTETFYLYGGNTKLLGDGVTITLHVGEVETQTVNTVTKEATDTLEERIVNGENESTIIEEKVVAENKEENTGGRVPPDQTIPESDGNNTLFEGDIFAEEGIGEKATTTEKENTNGYTKDIRTTEPVIRVGLYELEEYMLLSSSGDYHIGSEEDPRGVLVKGGTRTAVSLDVASKKYIANAGTVSVFSKNIRFIPDDETTLFTLENFKNPVSWNPSFNDNRFRGIIEVAHSEKTESTWVVNEIHMETYLKGLTETSEVSPLEYHKSIAVAARSYALWQLYDGSRHRGKPFDVDAKIDQVYRGYNSELRLPTFSQAVQETEGVAVTYENEIALTPYFAQSDGRTRSYQEVWSGPNQQHLKSVDDSTNDGLRLFGHGVGLSARGALIQASRFGKTYDEILHHYYTGIELQQIYKEGEVPTALPDKSN